MSATITEIRKALQEKFGVGNYRIRTNGYVEVRGTMPNTNTTGWYLLDTLENIKADITRV